jgi:hypothetical protein
MMLAKGILDVAVQSTHWLGRLWARLTLLACLARVVAHHRFFDLEERQLTTADQTTTTRRQSVYAQTPVLRINH